MDDQEFTPKQQIEEDENDSLRDRLESSNVLLETFGLLVIGVLFVGGFAAGISVTTGILCASEQTLQLTSNPTAISETSGGVVDVLWEDIKSCTISRSLAPENPLTILAGVAGGIILGYPTYTTVNRIQKWIEAR